MTMNINPQNIGLLLVVVIFMFGVIGALAFIVYKKIIDTDPTKADTSIDPNITTAQEFVQFQDIKDGVIDLGSHRYRAILECSSVNYHLKTPTEKEMIEVGYEQFINSLKFPITMFIQTRVIDSTYISKTLENDMSIVRKKFPNLEAYMDLYLDSMKNLKLYLPNTKHKKKYVIIPFEDSYLMPELNDFEKYEYSLSELKNRAEIIKRGLEGIGINCKLLDTRDTVEMIYTAYHKEHYSPDKIDAIVDGDFFSLLTTGESRYNQLSSAMKMDLILNETQNKIRKDILLSMDIDKSVKEVYKNIYDEVDKLRDEVGSHYKEGQTKLNLYENNISRYNFTEIKNLTGLTDIKEEDIRLRHNNNIKNSHIEYQSNNKSISIPEYGQDSYEEHGFLDKYDRKRIAENYIENETDKYEEAYNRAHIHKSEYGIISDKDIEDETIYSPKINHTREETLYNVKPKEDIKTNNYTNTKQVRTDMDVKRGSSNIQKQPKFDETVKTKSGNTQKQQNKSKDKHVNKTNYYDENINNNNIPNFEIKVKELEKNKISKNSSKSLDDLSLEFEFNEENDSPNNRTRDLSFFDK